MARRGRRIGIVLIVLLVVIGGLLIAADRIGANVAEKTIAEKVSQQTSQLQIQSSAPDVTVGGFPFLTQVLAGKYEDIHIVLRDVSKGGLVLPALDVHAKNVKAEMNTLMSGEGDVVAEQIVGTATVGYASVRALFEQDGLELSEQGGKLRLRLPVTVADQRVTAIAIGEISSTNGRLRLAIADIQAEGVTLPAQAQQLLDQYKEQLSLVIALPPLPFSLKLENVRVLPEGLAISASAEDVPISG